jgi:hypothetical protein
MWIAEAPGTGEVFRLAGSAEGDTIESFDERPRAHVDRDTAEICGVCRVYQGKSAIHWARVHGERKRSFVGSTFGHEGTDVQASILPYALSRQIGVVVYSPMRSGLLTGAMTRERIAAMPGDDWRKSNPNFQEPLLSPNLQLVERMRDVGKRHKAGPGRSRHCVDVEEPCRYRGDRRYP